MGVDVLEDDLRIMPGDSVGLVIIFGDDVGDTKLGNCGGDANLDDGDLIGDSNDSGGSGGATLLEKSHGSILLNLTNSSSYSL